jgi:hypothetical protein
MLDLHFVGAFWRIVVMNPVRALDNWGITPGELFLDRDRVLHQALQVRHVVAGDSDELPGIRAGGVEDVDVVASWVLLVEIDLPVFPFSHRSCLQMRSPARFVEEEEERQLSFNAPSSQHNPHRTVQLPATGTE